jgi:hypothetical protein
MSTAPTPVPHASLSIEKGFEKFGRANTGADGIAFFGAENESSCTRVQTNTIFFFRSSVSGLLIIPNPFTNFL